MERKLKILIKLSVTAALIVLFGYNSYAQNLLWHENLDKAYELAKRENKTLMVFFTGSDWCGWCKKLNGEVFTKKEFENYAENNLVLVKVDFPRNIKQSEETKIYNQQLAQVFRVQGFPTVVLINTAGEVIGYTGYQDGGAASYVEHLKSFL